MPAPKPWEDLISQEDIGSFNRSFEALNRPITAGTKPAVVVIDMTLAFIDSSYPSGHSETGWPAVAANAKLLESARALELPIYFTKAFADVDHVVRPKEHGRWKVATLGSSPSPTFPGDVFPEALTPLPDEIVINKFNKPSGFYGTPLTSYLIYDDVDTVIVTGMTTSGCVRATVLDAFMNNFYVIVPHECSADRSQISHKVNLFDMHMKYADVFSLEETIEYMQSVKSPAAVAA